jgi:hypothetical protein
LPPLSANGKSGPISAWAQFLVNLTHGRDLFGLEDGELLRLLGPETAEEKRYAAEEPEARRRAWRGVTRRGSRHD